MTKTKFVKWVKAALIRAVKTFFQSFASMITVGTLMSQNDWAYIASSSAVALIYSIATSVAGLPEVKTDE